MSYRHDHEFLMVRDDAETVPCPRCGAGVGKHCVNTLMGGELNAPAHPQRIAAAVDTPEGTP